MNFCIFLLIKSHSSAVLHSVINHCPRVLIFEKKKKNPPGNIYGQIDFCSCFRLHFIKGMSLRTVRNSNIAYFYICYIVLPIALVWLWIFVPFSGSHTWILWDSHENFLLCFIHISLHDFSFTFISFFTHNCCLVEHKGGRVWYGNLCSKAHSNY